MSAAERPCTKKCLRRWAKAGLMGETGRKADYCCDVGELSRDLFPPDITSYLVVFFRSLRLQARAFWAPFRTNFDAVRIIIVICRESGKVVFGLAQNIVWSSFHNRERVRCCISFPVFADGDKWPFNWAG